MEQDLVIPKKLTSPILEYLLDDEKRKQLLQEHPPHRNGFICGKRNCITDTNDLSSYLVEIEKFLLSHYKITKEDIKSETRYGCLISYSGDGHRVGPHQDYEPHKGYTHTRFNFMISKPEGGGNPIMNEVIYDLKENQVWICPAGKHRHDTTIVNGKKPRILLSYGYFIKNKQFKKIFP